MAADLSASDSDADGSAATDPAGAGLPVADRPAAAAIFGVGLPLAERFAGLLAGPGVVRGLIGPRETTRIWDRHLFNCAVVAELLPLGARVVDVGSGAGLPGLALACARPDLRVDLVDTLQRRTSFLNDTVDELGLGDRVRVITGRVEDRGVRTEIGAVEWVTARALAPLDRLCRWCLPLLSTGGTLLAMKGRRAEQEVLTHTRAIDRAGGTMVDIVECGVGRVSEPTRVVRITKR